MPTLPDQSAPSTAAYLAAAGERLADLCTACGACLAACPMATHVGVAGSDGAAVTADLRRLARGAPAEHPDAIKWIGACAKSGLCVSACPEHERGLDAMLLVRIARQQAIVTTGQLPAKHDPTAFPRVKVFARLQLTDEELHRWL